MKHRLVLACLGALTSAALAACGGPQAQPAPRGDRPSAR